MGFMKRTYEETANSKQQRHGVWWKLEKLSKIKKQFLDL